MIRDLIVYWMKNEKNLNIFKIFLKEEENRRRFCTEGAFLRQNNVFSKKRLKTTLSFQNLTPKKISPFLIKITKIN
jgi:hypothetical protein